MNFQKTKTKQNKQKTKDVIWDVIFPTPLEKPQEKPLEKPQEKSKKIQKQQPKLNFEFSTKSLSMMAAGGVLVSIYFGLLLSRNQDWMTDEGFSYSFSFPFFSFPSLPLPFLFLFLFSVPFPSFQLSIFLQRKKLPLALFRAADKVCPNSVKVQLNNGILDRSEENYEGSIRRFERALVQPFLPFF